MSEVFEAGAIGVPLPVMGVDPGGSPLLIRVDSGGAFIASSGGGAGGVFAAGAIGPPTPIMGLGPDNRPKAVAVDVSGQVIVSGLTNGTVTSVGLSMPNIFSVSGSPVTTSGTLTAALVNQSANTVFSGPSSGGAVAPTFRALVAADIPSLDAGKITSGTMATVRLGSGAADATKFLRGDSTWQVFTTGTVTSVGLALPGELTVSNSPVTTTGTLTGAWATQTQNKVFASPNGSTNVPTFRALVANDLPSTLNATTFPGITLSSTTSTITLNASVGTSGQVLTSAGAGATPTWTTPTTGTVTSVGLSLPSFITVSNSPVTTSGTLTGTLATQVKNLVFVGPATGADAAPTFRALVEADLGTGTGSTAKFLRGDMTWTSTLTSGLTINGALLITTDNATDIGAVAANRPRTIYAGTSVVTTTLTGTLSTAAQTNVTSLGTLAANLIFTDNTYDIGASGATRPRTGYFGTSVVAPTVNATTAIQLNGTSINTGGTLTNVAYLGTLDAFTAGINLSGASSPLQVGGSAGTSGYVLTSAGAGATPTWTAVSVTSPLTVAVVQGGSGTTSTLTLQSTSGVGTTGADIIFKVGNNGGTEAARILNSGFVGIKNTAPGFLLCLGAATAAATATPDRLSLGGTYGNNAAGGAGNQKFGIYWDGSNWMGIGCVSNAIEYATNLDITHTFYTGGTLRLSINSVAITLQQVPRFNGTNSTGAGSALLSTNCPAVTATAPYTWISAISADGSTVYIPCWK